jgi:ATP-binding cassette, subfamily A (ABC1), member 3
MNASSVPSAISANAVNIIQRGANLASVQNFVWNQVQTNGPPFLQPNYGPLGKLPTPGFMTLQQMMDRFIIGKQVPASSLNNQTLVSNFLNMIQYSFPVPSKTSPNVQPNITAEFTPLTSPLNLAKAAALSAWMGLSESYAPQQIDVIPFPTFAYSNQTLFGVITAIFGIFFVLTYLLPVSRLIRGIVMEKETKISEGLRMQGVPYFVIILSHLAVYFILYFIITILVTIILVRLVFKNSGGGYVFALFFLFGLSNITFACLISVFFSKARTAATFGSILMLGSFFPYYAVNTAVDSYSAKMGASILSATAFGLGVGQIALLEQQSFGVTPQTANVSVGNFTFNSAIAMSFIDIFIYLILAWYADAVLPSWLREFGVPKPFYFCVTPNYWRSCCCPRKKKNLKAATPVALPAVAAGPAAGPNYGTNGPSGGAGASAAHTTAVAGGLADKLGLGGGHKHNLDPADPSFFEQPDSNLLALETANKCLKMTNLRKEFSTPDGTKVAVDDANLTLYEGQITCLLGHNGAGKSTTISMLTGLYPATSGSVSIFGNDVYEGGFEELYGSLGLVAQQDILWPELTVREHLSIFASLKNVPKNEVEVQILKAVRQVGLTEKIYSRAAQLSGGQKRKLCLAMALLGGSKFLILDEVTSGVSSTLLFRRMTFSALALFGAFMPFSSFFFLQMDPFSRRSTWACLQEAKREGRTILLCTHFMEEADLLGDRIAIMAEGSVRCAGSSLFLKNKFGLGYSLVVVKRDDLSGHTGADVPGILKLINSHIPEAVKENEAGQELKIKIPLDASSKFETMFADLEAQSDRLGVASYGMSITTLEDVFIRAADDAHALTAHLNHGHGNQHGAVAVPVPNGAVAVGVAALAQARTNARTEAGFPPDPSDLAAGAKSPGGTPVTATALSVAEMRRKARTELTGCSGFLKHLRAILIKRLHFARRDVRTLICGLIIPVVLVAAGLALIQSAQGAATQPSLQLSTAYFNNVPARYNAQPQYPNYVPVATFKSGYNSLVSNPDIANFLANIPSANATFTATAPDFQFTDTDSNTCPNPYNFLNTASLLPTSTYATWQNMSTWLLATTGGPNSPVAASIYGAVMFEGTDSIVSTQNATSAFDVSNGDNALTYTVYTNTTGLATAPLYVNLMNQAAYKRAMNGAATATIATRNYPLPLTKVQQGLFESALTSVAALLVIIAFSFIPASYAAFIVKEREVGAKHQQLISGVSITAYWLANFIFDAVTYLVPGFLAIALCYAFQIQYFTTSNGNAVNALYALFLLFGPAVAATTYVMSFAFKSASSAQTTILFINIGGVILLFASIIMSSITDTCKIDTGLRFLWRFFPTWSLGQGLYTLGQTTVLPFLLVNCYGPGTTVPTNLLDMSLTGWNILYLGLLTPIGLILTIAMDQFLARPHLRAKLSKDPQIVDAPHTEDSDVSTEREKVARLVQKLTAAHTHPGAALSQGQVNVGAASPTTAANEVEAAILVNRLRKVYKAPNKDSKPKVAVKDLSFSVDIGSIFGFLGINGAGKSTTLSILSGDVLPTSGTAKLAGYDILDEQANVRRLLGYCPQADPLLDVLTVREHLALYARIKGVPESALPAAIQAKMEEMDLLAFENKKAGTLSGGNKRKLTVACSLIGDPVLVFLDEPSSGMDPKARRQMQKLIRRIATQQKLASIILTTHVMEEVEALCNKVGIMVGGAFSGLGSIQTLKNKFGQGSQAELRVAQPSRDLVAALCARVISSPVGPDIAAGGLLRRDKVAATAHALGDVSRLNWLTENGPGWPIVAAFARSAHEPAAQAIPLQDFCSWWAEEDNVQAAFAFMGAAFPGCVLVERQGLTLRFKIPTSTVSLSAPGVSPNPSFSTKLGALFGKMERGKASGQLPIVSYSLSQVTLEQVFNQLASQQDLEVSHTVGGQGMVQQASSTPAPSPVVAVAVPVPALVSMASFVAPGLGSLAPATPSHGHGSASSVQSSVSSSPLTTVNQVHVSAAGGDHASGGSGAGSRATSNASTFSPLQIENNNGGHAGGNPQ